MKCRESGASDPYITPDGNLGFDAYVDVNELWNVPATQAEWATADRKEYPVSIFTEDQNLVDKQFECRIFGHISSAQESNPVQSANFIVEF